MKAKFSELSLQNYFVNKSKFSSYLVREDDIKLVKKKINNRIFSIDFEIFENADNPKFFYIELKIDSFPKSMRKTSGYDFMIHLTANFELTGRNNLSEKKEKQFILFSALPMVISLARSEISHLTANGIFGKYILPAINLPELIKDWLDKNQ